MDYANTNLNFIGSEPVNLLSSYVYPPLESKNDIITYNNDFYAQFDYTVGPLSLSVGDRVMCFHYGLGDEKFWTSVIGRYIDTRNEVVATSTTYVYEPITTFINDPSSFQMTNIDASLTYTFGALSLTAGGSYYNQNKNGKSEDYYYARISPILNLTGKVKINAQAIWCSEQTPEKLLTDTDVYAMLSVQKTFGNHLTLAAQWHDMFCSDLSAANFRLLYRF